MYLRRLYMSPEWDLVEMCGLKVTTSSLRRAVFRILAPYFKSNSRVVKSGAKTFLELDDYFWNMVMSKD